MSQPTSRLKYSYGRNVITLWKMPTTINMNTAERSLKEKFLIVKKKEEAFFFFLIFTTLASSKITGVARVHTLCLSTRVYLGQLRNLKEPLLLRLAENLATPVFWNILIPLAILRLPSCVHAKRLFNQKRPLRSFVVIQD